MKQSRVGSVLFIVALAPLMVLAVLALVGARGYVGVVTTGSGDHAALGAAWVLAWLVAVVVSPIAAVASVVARIAESRR